MKSVEVGSFYDFSRNTPYISVKYTTESTKMKPDKNSYFFPKN